MKNEKKYLKSYYIDPDTDEIVEYVEGIKSFDIYILYKDSIPVYVGQTLDVKTRVKQHKKNGKDFNSYRVAYTCYNETNARIAEQVLIAYINSTTPGLQNKNNIGKIGEIFHLTTSTN